MKIILLHCAHTHRSQVLKNEGITSFWRGFPTFYVRIAPHVMITLLAVDAANKALSKQGL